MKPTLVCTALLLFLASAKSLPIESESSTTIEKNAENSTETTNELNSTTTEKIISSTTIAPVIATTVASNSTAVATTQRPAPSYYNSVTNLINNVGYAFRIVMKLMAPLFNGGGQQKRVQPEDEAEYADFDDHNNENEGYSEKVLKDTFMRTVRQVAETGRQGLSNYYDFIVNEYSYKFWAVYMLLASGLLIYSAIAAIYYAKFNTSAVDYEVYDEARSGDATLTKPGTNPLGLIGSLVSVRTFQQIMDAISNNKFEER
ncbi:uncharacterized protein LOC132199926 [Neocloeon triangulifer]|uniref:uncharacterized protein LOC132199926 n=1 Tax=Neocloeon triangulifer TaxID=2078957 RepID=UPI00286ED575|nr:uncharacterized protein LOC132199926 [Neocloeon triangulifer]